MKKLLLIPIAIIFLLINPAKAQLSYFKAFALGNNANDRGTSMASDAAGNYYCTGMHTYWMDLNPLGTQYIVSNNGTYTADIYVAKYSQQGIMQWGFSIGGSGDEWVSKIITDANDNVYITGGFTDTVDFDPGAGTAIHISHGAGDVFLAKYDANGAFLWANTFGDSLEDRGNDVTLYTVGANTYAVVTGGYQSPSMDMDPGAGVQLIMNNGNAAFNTGNCFVAAYSSLTGAYDWAFNIGGFGGATGWRVTADQATGSFIVAGIVSGDSTDFDPGNGTFNLYSPGNGMVFFAKYSGATPVLKFADGFGGIYGETANGLQTDDAGNIYLSGYFNSDSMDIDPGAGTYYLHNYPNGVQDIYVSKFDTSGVLTWAFDVGGYYSEVAQDLVVDQTGHLFITGNFGDTVDFDPGPNVFNLVGQLGSDAYLAEYDVDGHFIDAIPFNGNGAQFGIGLCIIPSHKIGVTGFFSADTIDFDPGPAVHNLYVNGGNATWLDGFVAVYDYTWEGIEEAGNTNSLSVYPVPSTNEVTVQLKNASSIDEITITNALGETVYHSTGKITGRPFKTVIDCSGMSAGIYFIRALSGSEIFTGKMMKSANR